MSHFNQKPVIYNVGEIQDLVLQAKKGDSKAFSSLYHAYFTPLYRFVFSRTNDKEKTEDVVQQTFIRWYTALPNYELDKSPLQYLFVIARRLMIDEGRKNTTLELEEEFADSLADEDTIEHTIDVAITTEEVRKAMKQLTDSQQEVLELCFFSELSTKEVAEIIEKEEATVRQIKKRALAKLQELTTHLQ